MAVNWTPDDIPWTDFDPSKVDPRILETVKAASLVEANSADYVTYLCNVFANRPDLHATIHQWGIEEAQHGEVLARWAETADPDFDFNRSLSHFRDGYSLPLDASESVRGSQAGELIARCIVEVGTSSFYSSIRDASDEPVLREICRHIAADEIRHYRLFRDCLDGFRQGGKLPLPVRLKVAFGRIAEAEDDELAYAYYSANVAFGVGLKAYDRKSCATAYWARAMSLYKPEHIDRAVRMIFKAVDLDPAGRLSRFSAKMIWRFVSWRTAKLNAKLAV